VFIRKRVFLFLQGIRRPGFRVGSWQSGIQPDFQHVSHNFDPRIGYPPECNPTNTSGASMDNRNSFGASVDNRNSFFASMDNRNTSSVTDARFAPAQLPFESSRQTFSPVGPDHRNAAFIRTSPYTSQHNTNVPFGPSNQGMMNYS